jgi:hypothetical protein
MMIAGILAAVAIPFSQSFYHETQSSLEKTRKEQSPEKDTQQTYVSVPADAVVNSSVENENVQVPSLLDELFTTDEEAKSVSVSPAVFANIFKTFFRAFISPNAP